MSISLHQIQRQCCSHIEAHIGIINQVPGMLYHQVDISLYTYCGVSIIVLHAYMRDSRGLYLYTGDYTHLHGYIIAPFAGLCELKSLLVSFSPCMLFLGFQRTKLPPSPRQGGGAQLGPTVNGSIDRLSHQRHLLTAQYSWTSQIFILLLY